MYQAHFALAQKPFGLTPGTHFFCELPPHREALEVLRLALGDGEGFLKVTGEVGTGKTLLCRQLLNTLGDQYRLAWLPDPQLGPVELRWALAAELGLKCSANIDQQQLRHLLQRQLLGLAANGFKVVVILDEAQALPRESLEALRLLTNLETESRKLMQVVLFGQPELDTRLAEHGLRQLRQRITFSYRLRPLTRREVARYVDFRLTRAGRQAPLFSVWALRALAGASGGVPRLVNILAHKAMLLAYGQGQDRVGWRQVRAAVRDTEHAHQGWQLLPGGRG